MNAAQVKYSCFMACLRTDSRTHGQFGYQRSRWAATPAAHGQFRSRVIEACRQPGVSIAGVALANGLNANMLRKWAIDAEHSGLAVTNVRATQANTTAAASSFIAVSTSASAEAVPDEIRIEVQRVGTAMKSEWPLTAAAQCAAWLRDLLR